MALDGSLDHSLTPLAMLSNEASAYEREFGRFARWCEETPSCALHGQDVLAVFDGLVRQAEQRPLPAPRCVTTGRYRATVTEEDLRINVQGNILFKDAVLGGAYGGWSELATALADALTGDASGLSSGIATDDRYGEFAALAIECMDWVTPNTRFEAISANELLGQAVAPHTQGASQTWTVQAGCMGWPLPPSNPPRPEIVRNAPPILIVNALYDPSTAFPWAVGLLNQIEGSVLLARDGDGHTSNWVPGPSRTRDAIDTYLITGVTPPPNTVYAD